MILAIDIGNTNIVLGCIEGKRTRFIERLSTDKGKTELEYAIHLKNVLEIYGVDPEELEGGILSSVVPQITEMFRKAAEKVIKAPVKVVGPGLKTGLNIIMDNPGSLGSDLVVDSVAAMAEYPLPLIIVDMGTATTVCVLNNKGNYIGGMILPGVRTSLDALVANAAQLSQISLEAPKKIIGTNTLDCMKSGIIHGNASCIDGLITRIEEELGEPCTTVATGGLAKVIIPYCKKDIILDDNLLLKGLQIIYEKTDNTLFRKTRMAKFAEKYLKRERNPSLCVIDDLDRKLDLVAVHIDEEISPLESASFSVNTGSRPMPSRRETALMI